MTVTIDGSDTEGEGTALDEADRIAEVAALGARRVKPGKPRRPKLPALHERLDTIQRLLGAAYGGREPWTLALLAKACGVPHQRLQEAKRKSLEDPSRTLNPETARKVARYAGCDLRWLVFGEGEHGLEIAPTRRQVTANRRKRPNPTPIDYRESARLMARLVYPALHEELDIELLRCVESVSEEQGIARFLDRTCKIDALVRVDGRITTACSRVHLVADGAVPRNSFSLTLKTQYRALLLHVSKHWEPWGALVPFMVIEAYVDAARERLLSYGVVPTKALIEHVRKYLRFEDGRWLTLDPEMVWISNDRRFCAVPWKVLGLHVIPHWGPLLPFSPPTTEVEKEEASASGRGR